jgi:short-subunit dehydrogenase
MPANQLAVVTGATTGIGLELAKCCAQASFNLVIAADEPAIERVAVDLRRLGVSVEPVQADLATTEGVDKLCAAVADRPIDALLANAGIGLGKAFLEQDFQRVRGVVDTSITGTLYLIQQAGNEMLRRKSGRILITGSIAGFTPGSFQAVYNAFKAFLDSFYFALREELRDSGVTVAHRRRSVVSPRCER